MGFTTHERKRRSPCLKTGKVQSNPSSALIGRTPLIERLNVFFLEARQLLESPALVADALDRLSRAAGFDEEARQRVASHVISADHLGALMPPGLDANAILALARHAGFNQRVIVCPSTIVARELGAKCGREKVPTQLLKVSGLLSNGQRGGVEVFLPEVEPALAERWIVEGGTNHQAFRVATRESIHAIHNELRAVGYPLPEFMKDQPMENPVEHVLLIYVDLPDGRMEFIYYEEAESSSRGTF